MFSTLDERYRSLRSLCKITPPRSWEPEPLHPQCNACPGHQKGRWCKHMLSSAAMQTESWHSCRCMVYLRLMLTSSVISQSPGRTTLAESASTQEVRCDAGSTVNTEPGDIISSTAAPGTALHQQTFLEKDMLPGSDRRWDSKKEYVQSSSYEPFW